MTPFFLAGNLSSITFSATSTNSSYPLSNLSDYDPVTQWRSNSTANGQVLGLDLGAARAVNSIVLHNHNIEGTDVDTEDVKLQYDNADNPAFTNPVNAANLWTAGGSGTDPCQITFTSATKRYWRIRFGGTVALSNAPQFGQVFVGTRLEIDPVFPATLRPEEYETSSLVTLTGRENRSQSYGGRILFEIGARLVDSTWELSWRKLVQQVRGDLLPFYFVDEAGSVFLVRFAAGSIPSRIVQVGRYDVMPIRLRTLDVDQISYGVF